MKFDDLSGKAPAIDLLYPSAEKRDLMRKRRAKIESKAVEFSGDLMLDKLAKNLCSSNAYKMSGVLLELCNDEEIINYRLDVLDDLIAMPELISTLRRITGIMIENDKTDIYKSNSPDSFTALDVAVTAFEAFIECIEIMDKFIEKYKSRVRSEGVKKLLDFFVKTKADKNYTALCEDINLLREKIKNKIGSVTIAINLDENLVPVSAGIVEISHQKYQVKPSLLDRIIYHGAKFPENTVKGSLRQRYVYENGDTRSKNRIVNESEKALFEELDFVTEKYVEMVMEALDDYKSIGFKDVYSIEYQLDYYLGIIKMIENACSKGLTMCRPKILPASERKLKVKGLFDPIYFNEACVYNVNHKDKRKVVANDISLDDNDGFYILTGANNGGKTTFIRGLGICQVMAQAGLYVPAQEAEISVCDCIYTHFPKEEQRGIDSSRFTSEIKQFKDISDEITNHSLLLMNESIQSTTPTECVDIAAQLVHIFALMGVRGVFATHLTDVAKRAIDMNSDSELKTKIESIVVEVDEDTGERLYKIKKGLPGETSYANTVFEKFGLDINALKKKAQGFEW